MWTNQLETINQNITKYQIQEAGELITFRQYIHLLQNSAEFRKYFNALLAKSPFEGYFWEVHPVRFDQLDFPFEFVVVKNNTLPQRKANKSSFKEYFKEGEIVVHFPNYTGSTQLIAPTEISTAQYYSHIGAFVRDAPSTQIDAFWKKVGEVYHSQIGKRPKWLSTSGLGVQWLHVRVDARPKYYTYEPYKLKPD